ncbi:hypothetical protein OSTOST_24181 [Ostertagia ostertagi]
MRPKPKGAKVLKNLVELKKNNTVINSSDDNMVDRQLASELWYHGLLPREDIKMMLRNNGDFLVRTTEPVAGQPRAFVLSVMFRQELEDQGVRLRCAMSSELDGLETRMSKAQNRKRCVMMSWESTK